MQGHETNLGFWGLPDTPEKFFGTFEGVRGHAPLETLENGASQIG